MSQFQIATLIGSMRRRCTAVHAAGGGHTRYWRYWPLGHAAGDYRQGVVLCKFIPPPIYPQMIDESIHVSHIYIILKILTQHHLKPNLRFFFCSVYKKIFSFHFFSNSEINTKNSSFPFLLNLIPNPLPQHPTPFDSHTLVFLFHFSLASNTFRSGYISVDKVVFSN